MISPTGRNTIRMDSQGSGKYGAKRKSHWHKGVDYVGYPGENALAPITGTVIREAKPYANHSYSGCVITGVYSSVKLFYFKLDKSLIGKAVFQGDVIGVIQDIGDKSGNEGMLPHIHLEITHINPDIFINEL